MALRSTRVGADEHAFCSVRGKSRCFGIDAGARLMKLVAAQVRDKHVSYVFLPRCLLITGGSRSCACRSASSGSGYSQSLYSPEKYIVFI